jgi:hypothetical protein
LIETVSTPLVSESARPAALRHAGAVLAHDTLKELAPDELPLIWGARLLQAATEFRCALP